METIFAHVASPYKLQLMSPLDQTYNVRSNAFIKNKSKLMAENCNDTGKINCNSIPTRSICRLTRHERIRISRRKRNHSRVINWEVSLQLNLELYEIIGGEWSTEHPISNRNSKICILTVKWAHLQLSRVNNIGSFKYC